MASLLPYKICKIHGKIFYSVVFLHKSPNLDIFIFNFWFKSSPFRKLSVKCQTRPRLLIFHDIFVPQKVLRYLRPQKVPLLKISDDFIACDFWFDPAPQSKILATPMHGGWHFEPYPSKSLLELPKRE